MSLTPDEARGHPAIPPAKELIRRKRDGHRLEDDQLRWLAKAIGDATLSDAQVGAFAMAAFLNGLDTGERAALTLGMRDSGSVLRWDGLDRPVLDKHSTGGVGDKVSLILAPLMAACGAAIPMISGRGLGHTGGTLDKLESIPGYDVAPDPERLKRVVSDVGCAIVGQTADLAPADRRLYAIRDATGTVESIGLIVASILSKKLAAGLQGLVMDVKWGDGAFMAERDDARELARALVDVAGDAGLPTVALLTDMDSVLGTTAGNALEVGEAIGALTDPDAADPRLLEVTLALARRGLALGGLGDADPEATLRSGAAAERFERMVAALGGPQDVLRGLPQTPGVPVFAAQPGHVTAHRTRELGLIVTALGGNRLREDDAIDHSVGLSEIAPVGARVDRERPLCRVHARSDADAKRLAARVCEAFAVGPQPPAARPVVAEAIA